MILADCHTHSLCSPDSEAPMPAMAQRATELGLTTLCLTTATCSAWKGSAP